MLSRIIVHSSNVIPVGEYSIGKITVLSGKNGSGKTSLMRSLLLTLTGLGTELVPDPAAVGESDITFEFDSFELRRKRWNGATLLELDGAKVTQEHVAAKLGCPAKIWAIMFWPGLFFDLTTAQRRAFLQSVTPEINLQKLADEHFDGIKLPDGYSEKTHESLRKQLSAKLDKLLVDKEELKKKSAYTEDERELMRQHFRMETNKYAELAQQVSDHNKQAEAVNLRVDNFEKDPKYQAMMQQYRSANSKKNQAVGKLSECEKLLVDAQKQHDTFTTKCPTCGRDWGDAAKREEILSAKVDAYRKSCEELQKECFALGEVELQHRKAIDEFRKSIPTRMERRMLPSPPASIDERIAALVKERKEACAKATEKLKTVELAEQNLLAQLAATDLRTGVLPLALKAKLECISMPNFAFDFDENSVNIKRIEPPTEIDRLSSAEQIRFCIELSRLLAKNKRVDPLEKLLFIQHEDLLDEKKSVGGFQLIVERVVPSPLTCEVIK
jgi:hypothetical protein